MSDTELVDLNSKLGYFEFFIKDDQGQTPLIISMMMMMIILQK